MSVNSFAYYGSFVTINGFLALILVGVFVPFVTMTSNPQTDPTAVIFMGFMALFILMCAGVLAFIFNAAMLRSDLRPVK